MSAFTRRADEKKRCRVLWGFDVFDSGAIEANAALTLQYP